MVQQAQSKEELLPKVIYDSKEFRDPFAPDYLSVKNKAEQEKTSQEIPSSEAMPAVDINGLVWGQGSGYAIINNKVVTIGEVLGEGLQVIDINKEGVVFLFQGRTYTRTPNNIMKNETSGN
ncbi:MAG: hypothetical protein V1490_01855 [Candidatus Omnitrophota bacterium]|nr:general secretion pathway protein GspB [Candidatus Omnitrophota bacterium]